MYAGDFALAEVGVQLLGPTHFKSARPEEHPIHSHPPASFRITPGRQGSPSQQRSSNLYARGANDCSCTLHTVAKVCTELQYDKKVRKQRYNYVHEAKSCKYKITTKKNKESEDV